jgi:outer membrane protein assembly factor BamE (lipoprotein component of BamABCDE complex)
MNRFLILVLVSIFIQNCSLNKVIKRHGVQNLEQKSEKVILYQTNKNDIFEILGPPSTYSLGDVDTLIYIERATSSSKLTKLGGKKLLINNVLVLELDNRGLASKKDFFDKEDMQRINFTKKTTQRGFSNTDFVYDFLSSIRKKINDPTGKKRSLNKSNAN